MNTSKQYKMKNKEVIAVKSKEYARENKEQIAEYLKTYREQHCVELSEYKSEKLECECGCYVSRAHMLRHTRSAKHQQLMLSDQ